MDLEKLKRRAAFRGLREFALNPLWNSRGSAIPMDRGDCERRTAETSEDLQSKLILLRHNLNDQISAVAMPISRRLRIERRGRDEAYLHNNRRRKESAIR